MERRQLINEITDEGFLPLFYHDDASICLEVIKALYEGGVRTIEFTNRGSKAFDNFEKLVSFRLKNMEDLRLGIGTIRNNEEAVRFISAGADFLVSPCFDDGVQDAADFHKVLWIPGCMTPTEINNALQAGQTLIKLFPGNVLGPGFVEAIRPLFPDGRFLVTGGVEPTTESISKWFSSGVAGVGMGSKLITKAIIERKDFDGLKARASELKLMIAEAKSNKQKA